MTVNEAVLDFVSRHGKGLGTMIVRVRTIEEALMISDQCWVEKDGYYLVALLTIKEEEEEDEKLQCHQD